MKALNFTFVQKFACKRLEKLKPAVDFIHILLAHFLHKILAPNNKSAFL